MVGEGELCIRAANVGAVIIGHIHLQCNRRVWNISIQKQGTKGLGWLVDAENLARVSGCDGELPPLIHHDSIDFNNCHMR